MEFYWILILYKWKSTKNWIGISQDGKELIIATIDGRDILYRSYPRSFSMILKDLGAYNAINLDGDPLLWQ